MISNQADGELTCTCNECGYEEYGGTLEFQPFIRWLRGQGWKIYKDSDTKEWHHLCPPCKVEQ